nr:type II secretion system minor pseudopilin GspK [Pseudomonas sp. LJDD11]
MAAVSAAVSPHLPTRQRGVAIISALLIVTVVAVIAAGMLARQGVFTRTLEAEQFRVQGSQVLLGGLEAGRRLLWVAGQQDSVTRPDQLWNQPLGQYGPGNAGQTLEARLQDQQGKFNLHNLLLNERLDSGQLRSFERLCAMIDIDPGLARRISARVIASFPHYPEGADSLATGRDSGGFSNRLDAARRPVPASLPILSQLSDLRSIAGIDEAVLERLGRYVSIIPGNTWVNSNTASAEVLAAVVPGLALDQARVLVQARDRGQWFINRGDFVNRLGLAQVSIDSLNVGITSEWFLYQGQTRQERRRSSLEALLYRTQHEMPRVIWARPGV